MCDGIARNLLLSLLYMLTNDNIEHVLSNASMTDSLVQAVCLDYTKWMMTIYCKQLMSQHAC